MLRTTSSGIDRPVLPQCHVADALLSVQPVRAYNSLPCHETAQSLVFAKRNVGEPSRPAHASWVLSKQYEPELLMLLQVVVAELVSRCAYSCRWCKEQKGLPNY